MMTSATASALFMLPSTFFVIARHHPCAIIMSMTAAYDALNSRQQKTVLAILGGSGMIEYRRVESLLLALGFKAIEGRGSRVRFQHKQYGAFLLHRPHPERTAPKGMIDELRDFLCEEGITP